MEYEGTAWTTYDAAFRRQVAATGHTQWSQVNLSLYTICFTGRVKRMGRCELCLSSAHRHDECPLVADKDPDIGRRMKAVESAVVAFSAGGQGPQHQQKAREICMLFNDHHCKFQNCTCVDCVSLQWSARRRQRGGPSQHEGLSGGSRSAVRRACKPILNWVSGHVLEMCCCTE